MLLQLFAKNCPKLLPSFFCHNDGFFRKPTSPPLPLMRDFFLKSPRPSLPLKRAPPLISVFSPQGRRGNRSSSSLVTISFYGWRTIRGLRQQQSCVFLCGDEPAFTQGLGCGLLDRCSMLAECSLDARCWLAACSILAACLMLDACRVLTRCSMLDACLMLAGAG